VNTARLALAVTENWRAGWRTSYLECSEAPFVLSLTLDGLGELRSPASARVPTRHAEGVRHEGVRHVQA